MSYRFEDSFRAGPGWNCSSILVLLELVHLVGFITKVEEDISNYLYPIEKYYSQGHGDK